MWLLTIARRVAADHLRQHARRPVVLGGIVDADEPVAGHEQATSQSEWFWRRRWPPWPLIGREAFVLTQIVGLGYAEAAEVCECPVGTIRSRVAQARADLGGAQLLLDPGGARLYVIPPIARSAVLGRRRARRKTHRAAVTAGDPGASSYPASDTAATTTSGASGTSTATSICPVGRSTVTLRDPGQRVELLGHRRHAVPAGHADHGDALDRHLDSAPDEAHQRVGDVRGHDGDSPAGRAERGEVGPRGQAVGPAALTASPFGDEAVGQPRADEINQAPMDRGTVRAATTPAQGVDDPIHAEVAAVLGEELHDPTSNAGDPVTTVPQ